MIRRLARVMVIAGARPNFIKVAPLLARLRQNPNLFESILVHTGQHFDADMSDIFFRDLAIPAPDVTLGIGPGTHAVQTATVMLRLEPVICEWEPDWIIVVGDVNSTLAAALTAAKTGVRVAHVEAGLRSHDRKMPEEHNRVLTDHLSDLLFTPSPDANTNLRHEGIPPERIRFVGNVMIDSLVALLPLTRERAVLRELGLWPSADRPDDYVLVTLHRPSNVDDPGRLHRLLEALSSIATKQPVVFPVHPRTGKQLTGQLHHGLKFTKPLGYLDFLALERYARVVVTDSGGVQEETTFLGVPCLTVRANTERPVTVLQGTNRLVGSDPAAIVRAIETILTQERQPRAPSTPALWDGRASDRIVRAVAEASGVPASQVRSGTEPATALELREARH